MVINIRKDLPDLPEDEESVILERIKNNVEEWNDYFSHNIRNYRINTKFAYLSDGQWSPEEITEYSQQNRPRLTFNMIPRMISTLVGEYFDFSPDLMVRAIDSTKVPQDKIDFLTNITREISFKSRNNIIYQTATDCAITGGFGAFLVGSQHEHPMSFNMVPHYYQITDPTTCFWDKIATRPNKEDGDFCGIRKIWKKELLVKKYPDAKADLQSFSSNASINPLWETKDEITIVDYWEKIYYKRKVALLSTNEIIDADEAENRVKELNAQMSFIADNTGIPHQKVTILKEESRDDWIIMFYRATHNKILEKSKWNGKKLPLIFQSGYTKWIDGKEHTYSFVEWLKDTQRAYNYARNEYLYRLKLTRYEPYLLRDDLVGNHEAMWKNIYDAKSALLYKKTADNARPERVAASEIPQSLSIEIERSYGDFQRISGRFDANLGAPSNETSGIAILNRQRPGNKSVQNFFNNSLIAIQTGANVAFDLMQHLYDTDRSINILMANGKQSSEVINAESGAKNNVSDGLYLVEVKATANFELQRIAQLDELDKAISKYPKIAEMMPDILIQLTGIKDAGLVVDRIQKFLMPEITVGETKDPKLKEVLTKQLEKQQQIADTQTQLAILNQQAEIQSTQTKALTEKIDSLANLMTAQTKRDEVGIESMLEARKINAEEDRTVISAIKDIQT